MNNMDAIHEPYSQSERDLMLKLSKFNEVIEFSFLEKAPNNYVNIFMIYLIYSTNFIMKIKL